MNDPYVSLELAQALKTIWYPQDQWPQMVYWRWKVGRGTFVQYTLAHRHTMPGDQHDWYAAPTPLQALEWLEVTTAWEWERWRNHEDGPYWTAQLRNDPTAWEACNTTNDLILAILKHLQEAQ